MRFGFRRNAGAQFGEDTAFDLDYLLLRVQNFGFVFLQLGRGETLSIDQCLLAFVVRRRVMQVGSADLKVIAEDGVELYLQ